MAIQALVFDDLAAGHNTKLDRQLMTGTGAQTASIRLCVTGINAMAYTDATPTIPELWPKLADAVAG